jgi:hypothetical protein
MNVYKGTLSYALRFLIVIALIFGNLFLLSLIPHVVKADTASPDSAAQNSGPLSDNPNAVSNSLSTSVYRVGQAMNGVGVVSGRILNTTTATSAKVVAGTGAFVAHGATFVGHGFISSLAFMARVPSTMVGSFTTAPVVSSAIKPKATEFTPVIDPDAANKKATAMLATANIQPQTQAPTPTDDTPVWPIHGIVTTPFGVVHWPYQPTHTGLDISDGKPAGITPIRPYRPGKVVDAIWSNSGLGNHVVVDHGGGITSVYGHMSSLVVKPGQQVDKNTVIGYEGSTGASTGTHLHFEIRVNGQPRDPHQFVTSPL